MNSVKRINVTIDYVDLEATFKEYIKELKFLRKFINDNEKNITKDLLACLLMYVIEKHKTIMKMINTYEKI